MLLFLKNLVYERDRNRSFADSRGNSFHIFSPNVTRSKNSGQTGFEQARFAIHQEKDDVSGVDHQNSNHRTVAVNGFARIVRDALTGRPENLCAFPSPMTSVLSRRNNIWDTHASAAGIFLTGSEVMRVLPQRSESGPNAFRFQIHD